MHRCELHLIQEWRRDGGRTDVDNLVAVCRKHQKRLETENLVVIRTASGYEGPTSRWPGSMTRGGAGRAGNPGRIVVSLTQPDEVGYRPNWGPTVEQRGADGLPSIASRSYEIWSG